MSGMNGVFAKRRARLLAMKAIRDNHIPGDKAITCPKCGQDSDRKSVAPIAGLRSMFSRR